tara:strand:+ start:311 stop:448 length:138 start_codon:yes stop_codon:yes gene_type:complete
MHAIFDMLVMLQEEAGIADADLPASVQFVKSKVAEIKSANPEPQV